MDDNKTLSLQGLTQQMLSSRMPLQDDIEAALFELGIKPTCGATLVYSMILKACKGDTSAAKFIKELNGEGGDELEAITGVMTAYSEGMLRRMVGQLPIEATAEPKPKRSKTAKAAVTPTEAAPPQEKKITKRKRAAKNDE